MRHLTRSTLVLVALGLVLVSRPAGASDPNSIYTVPFVVEILPNDATGNRMMIGGAFFFLANPMTFTYGEPRCGYMSFQCAPGQETMCRMQWLDIRRNIGQAGCSGFGTLGMLSTAHLRADRGSLGTPDPWDLGMGISVGSFVDGKCPKARMLNCAAKPAPPPPDASAPLSPDAAVAIDAPVVAPSVPDASTVPAPDAGSPPVPADAAATPTTPAPDAAGPAPALAKSDGCAVGGGQSGAWPAVLLLALALVRRTRRR